MELNYTVSVNDTAEANMKFSGTTYIPEQFINALSVIRNESSDDGKGCNVVFFNLGRYIA